jgi:uncharacterized membrane protein YhaH (DUF805 family)
MTPVQAIRSCIVNGTNFSTRASRSEFCWWWLFFVLLHSLPYALHLDSNHLKLYESSLSLLMLLPGTAVFTRRLHDFGKSGWWQLLPIVIFFFGVIFPKIHHMSPDSVRLAVMFIGAGVLLVAYWGVRQGTPGGNRYGAIPL